MGNKPLISIVLPSLNVADYIRETIDSVVNQTMQDIEILCIDAGSTDGTVDIIKEYVSKDNRVRYIHSDIRSYGHQMNMGIDIARGEYIGIVETDDYVDRTMYEELYKVAVNNDLDIVKSNYRFFLEIGKGKRHFEVSNLAKECALEYYKLYSCEDYIDGTYRIEVYIWDAIYRTDFLKDNDIRFNESPGASYQDFGFKFLTCLQADRIMVIEGAYYNYRKDNPNSSTYNPNAIAYNLRESIYVCDKLSQKLHDRLDLYKRLVEYIARYCLGTFAELCRWIETTDAVREALLGYVKLYDRFRVDGVYAPEVVGVNNYKQLELMSREVDTYIRSVSIMSKVESELALDLVNACKDAHRIVIFGCGLYGRCALTFLRACNVGDNVVAYADNNSSKQGEIINYVPIVSVNDCIRDYPNALYIIASPANSESMKKQLIAGGINKTSIINYNYSNLIASCAGGTFER